MAPNIDPEVISQIARALAYRREGAAVQDIIDGFAAPPNRQTVERWIAELLDADLLECESHNGESRYFITERAREYLTWTAPGSGASTSAKPELPASIVAPQQPAEARQSGNGDSPSRSETTPAPGTPTPITPAALSNGSGAASSTASGTASGMGSGIVSGAPTGTANGTPTDSADGSDRGAPPATSPGPSDGDRMQFAFEQVVPFIVGRLLPRLAAIAALRQKADEALPESARAAFVQYGLDRLSHLTLGEALRHKLDPAQYEIWRRQYFGAPATSAPPPAPTVAPASIEPAAPVAVARGGKRRKKASDSGAEDATSAVQSGAEVIAAALKPILDAAAPAAPQTLAKLQSRSTLADIPNAVKAVGRLASGRLNAKTVTAALSGLWALFFGVLSLLGWPLWLIFTLLVAVSAIVVATIYVARRRRTATASATDLESSAPRATPWKVYLLGGGIAIAAIATAGAIWYLYAPRKPSTTDVGTYLTNSLAPLPVRVAAIDLTFFRTGSAGCTFRYDAQVVTTAPLYQQLNTGDYLNAHAAAEMAAIDAAEKAQAGLQENGVLSSRIAVLGPAPTPALRSLVLVKIQTPPGKPTHLSGTLDGWWNNGAWAFSSPEGQAAIAAKSFSGTPNPANALAVDIPADAARLNSLIVEHAAYAAKVQAAATALAADLERERQQKAVELERARQQQAADLERERQQKLTALNQLLQRGTWFRGVFVDLPKPDSHRVLLEVTDCSATTHEIILLARNDGGWFNTRPMTGTWAIGADGESCTASVRSNTFDAIQGAGFLIEEPHTTALTLKVRLDGSVSADPRNWNLQRVAPENVAATKAEFGFGRTVGAGLPRDSVSDRPLDRSTVTPATVPPIDRSTVASGAPQAPSLPANAVPALTPADLQFFSVAASPAAYVRVDGTWVRLPQNSAQAIQSVPQKLTGALAAVSRWEDKLAGKSSSTSSASEAGAIKFDGIETVPVVPANEVLIAYVGPLTPVSAEAKARYPELKDYPIIELAPERTAAKGVRYATLYRLPGGLLGFANTRVLTATIEQPAANVTLLRSTAPLRRGQYAVACGDNSYEVKVE